MNIIDYRYFFLKKIKNFHFIGKPNELYSLIDYNLSIKGNFLRPILCIISYSFFKNDFERIFKYALGLEMIHNSLLIYDDIMDNASLRRGYETMHKKFGYNQAILLGNSLLMKSYQLFSNLEPLKFKNVLCEISYMIMKICEGQQMDISFEKIKNITLKQYLNMIINKTASFIASSLKIGAIIGNCNKKNANYLYNIGKYIGIAYQIKDDLINILSDFKTNGKENNTDIINNKKTILYVKALKYANKYQKQELLYWYSIKKYNINKINSVKKIFHELFLIEKIKKDIEIYKNNSLFFLEKLEICYNKKKQILIEFINEIL